MKILYIPFKEENDLLDRALYWKNMLVPKKIFIVQHGTEINYSLLRYGKFTLYILAHGTSNLRNPFLLASHSFSLKNSTYLDIEQIADRYNSDFAYVHTNVAQIKLYFCNKKGNQKDIAKRFKKNLILSDPPIDYYAGTLFAPGKDRKKFAVYDGFIYPTSLQRSTLLPKIEKEEKADNLTYTPHRF